MNRSINALEKLEDVINQSSQQAHQQLQAQMMIRNEIVDKVRSIYLKSYQQVERQIRLEIENFENLKKHYEKQEGRLDVHLKEKYEQEIMSQVKQKNIQEYQDTLATLYDIDNKENKKDNAYYQMIMDNFKKRIEAVKTASDCENNLKILRECQKMLQESHEEKWISEHEEVKKMQKILKAQTIQIGNELENQIKNAMTFNDQGIILGKLLIDNDYLNEWVYQEQILKTLETYHEGHQLKMLYQDDFNDYLIEVPDFSMAQELLIMLEFSTLLKSTTEAIHIYYDDQFDGSLLSSLNYINCEKIVMNDDFITIIKEELKNYPQQKISVFIQNGNQLSTKWKEWINEKPENIQFVICQTEAHHEYNDKDFICLQSHLKEPYFVMNGKYHFYIHKISEQGMLKLQNSQPVSIEKVATFHNEYKEHLGKNSYLIGKKCELPFDDNMIIVSKDEQKRNLFLAQMLLQCLSDQKIFYIYYEDYNDHPLRTIVDSYPFEDIIPDMMSEMMEDYLDDQSFVIFVDPTEDMLGYIATLLDEGHVLMTSDHVIEGYKNLNLDENMIQEYDDCVAGHFELLDASDLQQIIKEIQ